MVKFNDDFLDISPRDYTKILEHRKNQYDRNIELESQDIIAIDTLERFLRKDMIDPLLEIIDDKTTAILKDINFKLLPSNNPNAYAFFNDETGSTIILNSLLLGAISFYNEVQIIGANYLKETNDQDGFYKFVRHGHKYLIECFLKGTNLPLPPAVLSKKEFALSNFKTLSQELFIVAHELAHIYLGHVNKNNLIPITVKFDGNDKKVYTLNLSQEMELEADEQATNWLVKAQSKNLQNDSFKLINGNIGLSIEVFILLHIIEVNTEIPDETASHPSALIRLYSVLDSCKNKFKEEEISFTNEMIRNALYIDTFKI